MPNWLRSSAAVLAGALAAFVVLLLLAGLLAVACCSSSDPYKKMDRYCLSWCQVSHKDTIRAEWLGNDPQMHISQCMCYLGEDEYSVGIMAPWRDYER